MSVINKMLRDLDQRGAGPMKAGTSGARSLHDTVSVKAEIEAAARPAWRLPLLAVLLLSGLAAATWLGLQQKAGGAAPIPSSAVLAPMVTPPSSAAAAPTVLQATSEPVAAAESPAVLVQADPLPVASEVNTASKLPSAPVPVQPPSSSRKLSQSTAVAAAAGVGSPERPAEVLRMDLALQKPPTATPKPVAETAEPALVSTAAVQALAQAQNLWRSGSRGAAIDLLGSSLTLIEGPAPAGPPLVEKPVLASLARELARMQLADGQVAQALLVLQRLEPQLSQFADLWAMRGNAAQRLGQHAQAVHSYQQALLMKPDEARWMLGQAVSLAALGQTESAAGLAEKARQQGALPADVAHYLRQLGVNIRTD